MGGLQLYVKPSMELQITENLKVKDIKNANIGKLNRDIILASKCAKKIRDRKGEVFTEEMCATDDMKQFIGKEIRQVEIRQHINKSILDAGLTNSWEAEDIEYLITSVLTDVLTDFGHLTTQEVGIAFRQGSREEYGKNYGISARAYYSWLRTYDNEIKLRANKELIKLEVAVEEQEPTEEEKQRRQEAWLDTMCKEYEEYLETGHYNLYDLNNMLYDYLKELGLIHYSKEVKAKIWEDAKEMVKLNNNPLNARNQTQRNKSFDILKALEKNEDSVQGRIIKESKRLALRKYLMGLRQNKQSLREIIIATKEQKQK